MSVKDEIELILGEMATVKAILISTVDILPSFDITDPEVLPYGLRVHTRSMAGTYSVSPDLSCPHLGLSFH